MNDLTHSIFFLPDGARDASLILLISLPFLYKSYFKSRFVFLSKTGHPVSAISHLVRDSFAGTGHNQPAA
jgi:hypothetical protein